MRIRRFLILLTLAASTLGVPNVAKHQIASAEAQSMLAFAKTSKDGYTIWGVKPSERLDDILSDLPENVEVIQEDLDGKESKIILKDPKGRRLTLLIDGTGEAKMIRRIGVFPVTPLFSLERSGVAVLRGTDGPEKLKKAIPNANQVGGGYEVHTDGTRIHIEFLSGTRMLSAGISSAR